MRLFPGDAIAKATRAEPRGVELSWSGLPAWLGCGSWELEPDLFRCSLGTDSSDPGTQSCREAVMDAGGKA